MSFNLQINVINSDNMTINQIKREKFRTTIRKQQLESLFQQNRQIHKLGNQQLDGNENTKDLLNEFFKTGQNLDKICNVIDSQDVFEVYNQISESIDNIKLHLNQPLNHQIQFLTFFKILNNCILVKPTTVKQLIRDKNDNADYSIINQIFNILESEEWKELHETCLQTLNYFIEQDNKIILIIEIERKQFVQQIINWGNNLGSIEYLQNLTEFLSLYLQQNGKITIENQYKTTKELITRALNIKDLQIIYGILLLSFCLQEKEFTEIFGEIINIIEFFIQQLKQNLSDFEYIVIFKGIKDCIKRMPDIFLYMMSQYYIIELLYEYSQKLKKQAGKDCLKLIACCYKTYINIIFEFDLDQTLNQQIKKNLYEFSNKFIILYLDSDFNLSYKIKILDKLFKFCKFVEYRQQQITQFDLNLYVKYFLIINNALRQDNLRVEQIFYIIEALQNLIQIEDMEQQKEILKLIPNELMDILNDLSLHENQQLADEIQNLIILFQFC